MDILWFVQWLFVDDVLVWSLWKLNWCCSFYDCRDNNFAVHVTLEDTKKATVLLIRKLFLLIQNLDALPNNVHLTMNLYYYDESECMLKEFTSSTEDGLFKCLSPFVHQSPRPTTNRRASRRANVIVSGLRVWQHTLRWVRCKQASTPSECVCRQNKNDRKSSRRGTASSRPCRRRASR